MKTDEGRLHTIRIAGIFSIVALLPGCRYFSSFDTLCVLRIVFTAGWWLAFCGKRPAHTLSEMAHPIGILGITMVVLGLAGQFYLTGH